MSNTYVFASRWEAGCDDCGKGGGFDTKADAEAWADDHECEVD